MTIARGTVMRVAAIILDIILVVVSIFGAYVMSVGEMPAISRQELRGMAVILLVFIVSAAVLGLNRGSWRYVSIADLMKIIKTVIAMHLALMVFLFSSGKVNSVPKALPIISALLLISLLSGVRILYRAYKEHRSRSSKTNISSEPVIIVGYGDKADSFIRALRRMKMAPYRVLGLVDVSGRNNGRQLHGVPIVGEFEDIKEIVADFVKQGIKPTKILIATDRIQAPSINKHVEWASENGILFLSIPSASDSMKEEQLFLPKPQALRIEDLLGRRHSDVDLSAINQLIEGHSVLVTGAGGSIGSELVRQLAKMNPSRLILLDNGEYNLYRIDHEIKAAHANIDIRMLYCDVRDRQNVAAMMHAEKPEFVFHAAALKHVPLVEENPLEGLHTNVLGTRNLADMAIEVGTRAFVMISTDKAVNPTNVMGASKRFAEAYCQMLGQNSARNNFITVRFGNVLGSTGSVVPLFKEQIERGGPVTVTHPDIERYFMTINEAVTLVLAASAICNSSEKHIGKIMVLEMGRPIKVDDLARRMIRLAGFVPDKDIEIVYSGLRAGEKMFEEKFEASEKIEGTNSPWLLAAKPRTPKLNNLRNAMEGIEAAIKDRDTELALKSLREVVPEFISPENPADVYVKPHVSLRIDNTKRK
jgi:FlaA1/EpsC-like NDP-sugar epimerase